MQVGIIGLGRMGTNRVGRLLRGGTSASSMTGIPMLYRLTRYPSEAFRDVVSGRTGGIKEMITVTA